jgi:hypothetical protein
MWYRLGFRSKVSLLDPEHRMRHCCKLGASNIFRLNKVSFSQLLLVPMQVGWSDEEKEMLATFIQEYIEERHFPLDPGQKVHSLFV